MGIVAGVIIPLVAMLGFALGSSRQAGEAQFEARLVNELVGEVQTADWTELSRIDGEIRYYDRNGARVASAAGAIHAAVVDFPGRGVEVPGGRANRFLRLARIRVTTNRGARPEFDGWPGPLTYREFTTWIAQRDKEALR